MRSKLLDRVEALRDDLDAIGFCGTWQADYRSEKLRFSEEASTILPFASARLDDPVTLQTYDQTIHPEDLDWIRAIRTRSTGSSHIYICEYRLIDGAGAVRWLQCHGRATVDRHGEIVSAHGISLDVTEFKASGDSVQASPHAPFAHPVNHLADGLMTAGKAAREMGHDDIERSVSKLLRVAARILAGRIVKAIH